MNKESNIDKLFRNSLKDKEYAFNEASWGNMESMLDAKSSTNLWYRRSGIAATLLVLIGSVSAIWFATQDINSVQRQPNASTKNVASNKIIDNNTNQNIAGLKIVKKSEVSNSAILANINKPSSIDRASAEVDKEQKTNKANTNNASNFAALLPLIEYSNLNLSLLEENIDLTKKEQNFKFGESTDYKENTSNISPIDKIQYSNYETQDEYFDLASNATDPVDATQIVNKRHALAFSIGNTFNHGFSNNSGIFGNNILHSIGIQYSYQLNNHLNIVSGLFYKSKTGNNLSLNYTEEKYAFGKSTTQTQIKINSLHYVEIPLLVDYNFKQKHHAIVGLSLGYLTGVRNRVGKTKTETLAGSQTEYTTEWGMNEYFNTTDLGLKFGYEYELTKNINAGVNAQFGLMDVTNNTRWNNSDKFTNTEVQVTLKYKFIRF